MSNGALLRHDAQAPSRGGRLLRAARLVGFPTETVYGLGANALDARRPARIFAAKGTAGGQPADRRTSPAAEEPLPPHRRGARRPQRAR